MSVVVGIQYKNKVWLACDKQITTGSRKSFLQNHHKINQVIDRPGVIIGSVGTLRVINLLETNNSYIDELLYLKNSIDYSYMVNAFPLLMQELLIQEGVATEGVVDLKNEFLVGVHDKLYQVGWDGAVEEATPSTADGLFYAALGSGCEMALGSVESSTSAKNGYNDKEIIQILVKAVQVANSNIYCGGGVVIENTAGKHYEIELNQKI